MMISFVLLLGLVFMVLAFAATLITLALVVYRIVRKGNRTANIK